MGRFALHLVTDPRVPDLIGSVAAACRGGVDVVQVREKTAPALEVFHRVLALQEVLRPAPCTLIVNDRADVAVAAGADGVHLAAKSLPVASARIVVGPRLIGQSVHSLEEAVRAAEDGANYVTYGHVYPTQSKPGLAPRSLGDLQRIVEQVPVPVIAIGGITAENVAPVLETGCAGIAVISAILDADNPAHAASRLRSALDASAASPRHQFSVIGNR